MRFIDLAFVQPPEGFAARVADAEVDGEENIDNHSDIWRDCKANLKQASHNKCYYCEMIDLRSDGTVDHYRPKSKYKWAAYRFDNFRFACTYCNSRRVDKKTGEIGGKGAGFPLFHGCARATCYGEAFDEHPILLDPCTAADPGAIDFRSDGVAVPKSNDQADPQRRRADDSIKAYHLNHSDLEETRRRLAIEIQEKMTEAENSMKRYREGDQNARQGYTAAVRDLARKISPTSELSAFSKRILQAYKTKPFVEDILATV